MPTIFHPFFYLLGRISLPLCLLSSACSSSKLTRDESENSNGGNNGISTDTNSTTSSSTLTTITSATTCNGQTSSSSECTPLNIPTGNYYFTLSIKPSPTKPIVFAGEVMYARSPDSLPMVEFTALAADDQTTPVGDLLSAEFVDEGDGSFSVNFDEITIPADANAINGAEIVTTLELQGTSCQPGDFICGSADGDMTQPLSTSLNGSTFTWQRICDEFPDPILNCAGDSVSN